MRLVRFGLAYGGTIMVNPEHVYLIEDVRDGVRIHLTPGDGKKSYTLNEHDMGKVADRLTGGFTSG